MSRSQSVAAVLPLPAATSQDLQQNLALWIVLLTLLKRPPLEGPAFNLLALLVPLEGIILSCIVLHSQGRQAERERIRNDAETEANLKAEQEILNLHEKVDALAAELRNRLPESAQAITHPPSETPPVR